MIMASPPVPMPGRGARAAQRRPILLTQQPAVKLPVMSSTRSEHGRSASGNGAWLSWGAEESEHVTASTSGGPELPVARRALARSPQFKPLPREDRAASALDTRIHVEYGADRERLLASSRASGILPTTFRIAVLPIGSAAGSLPGRRPIRECSTGTRDSTNAGGSYGDVHHATEVHGARPQDDQGEPQPAREGQAALEVARGRAEVFPPRAGPLRRDRRLGGADRRGRDEVRARHRLSGQRSHRDAARVERGRVPQDRLRAAVSWDRALQTPQERGPPGPSNPARMKPCPHRTPEPRHSSCGGAASSGTAEEKIGRASCRE